MHESALDYHAVKNGAPNVQVEAGKGRPEAFVGVSACVCDCKRVFEWRLILKDAAKRLAAFRSCLARNTKLFSTNLLIADSSL
jgi:hypothetical protein